MPRKRKAGKHYFTKDHENAIIEFDKTKTNEAEIEKAINSSGYKVTDKKEN